MRALSSFTGNPGESRKFGKLRIFKDFFFKKLKKIVDEAKPTHYSSQPQRRARSSAG